MDSTKHNKRKLPPEAARATGDRVRVKAVQVLPATMYGPFQDPNITITDQELQMERLQPAALHTQHTIEVVVDSLQASPELFPRVLRDLIFSTHHDGFEGCIRPEEIAVTWEHASKFNKYRVTITPDHQRTHNVSQWLKSLKCWSTKTWEVRASRLDTCGQIGLSLRSITVDMSKTAVGHSECISLETLCSSCKKAKEKGMRQLKYVIQAKYRDMYKEPVSKLRYGQGRDDGIYELFYRHLFDLITTNSVEELNKEVYDKIKEPLKGGVFREKILEMIVDDILKEGRMGSLTSDETCPTREEQSVWFPDLPNIQDTVLGKEAVNDVAKNMMEGDATVFLRPFDGRDAAATSEQGTIFGPNWEETFYSPIVLDELIRRPVRNT